MSDLDAQIWQDWPTLICACGHDECEHDGKVCTVDGCDCHDFDCEYDEED